MEPSHEGGSTFLKLSVQCSTDSLAHVTPVSTVSANSARDCHQRTAPMIPSIQLVLQSHSKDDGLSSSPVMITDSDQLERVIHYVSVL